MSETKVPRPRNVLMAEFEGLSKEDASQALRDAGGDLDRARALVRRRRANPDDKQAPAAPQRRDDDEAASLALARQLQAAFARRFGTAPPVLCFDATRWEAPFSEDDDAGHEGTTEAASASMRSTRDGGVDG